MEHDRRQAGSASENGQRTSGAATREEVNVLELVVQRLLKKHADDQIIAEANGSVTSWHIPETMSEPRYADLLQERARKCGNVY